MTKITYVKSLKAKGYPTSDSSYKSAHEESDKIEKKDFPKGYNKLKKSHIKKHELMATHDKSGNIKIEKKFKDNKKELVLHERQELKNQRRLDKK